MFQGFSNAKLEDLQAFIAHKHVSLSGTKLEDLEEFLVNVKNL
ncbi:hypothetical protein ACFX2H_038942 [Malus domestica]